MHKVQPHQAVRILQIEIAVPANAADARVRDEISALLSESGVANPESNILDWQYTGLEWMALATAAPDEGSVFAQRPKIVYTPR